MVLLLPPSYPLPSFLLSTRSIGVRLEGICRTIRLPAGPGKVERPSQLPHHSTTDTEAASIRLFIGDEANQANAPDGWRKKWQIRILAEVGELPLGSLHQSLEVDLMISCNKDVKPTSMHAQVQICPLFH